MPPFAGQVIKIAIEPSMQSHNQYCCAPVVESQEMQKIGSMVVTLLNQMPGLEARLFWSADDGAWVGLADQGAAWADYVVAFHTDSAGDKRGYTGSLLCYGDDNRGRLLGQRILQEMTQEFQWPFYGEQYRQNDLHILNLWTPSCLLEMANHSDPDDCQFILNNPDKFATAIANGISKYMGLGSINTGGNDVDVEITPMIERTSNNDGIRRFTMFIDESIEDEWVCLGLPTYAEEAMLVEIYYLDDNGKHIGPDEVVWLKRSGPQFAQKRVSEGIIGHLNIDCHGLKGDAPYFRHVRTQ